MATSSIATVLSPTLTSNQLLTTSITSLSSSSSTRHASSQITKTYRQSSTLFLTRRLPESLSTILPVITPRTTTNTDENENLDPAPIAKASRSTRIKVWSLYLTILNAVLELEPEEGKQAFGGGEFRSLCNKVRSGEVWGEVVRNGYGGVEGDLDSDVVINLATLLLAHARTQKVTQQRLESYLAASQTPNLDLHSRLQEGRNGTRSPKVGGTDTPRDLNARVKILELYTLHVLLRNNEWDYSRDFITSSSSLDEERREAFLQALQSLWDEQEEVKAREKEEVRYAEEVRKLEEMERERRAREEELERGREVEASEHDYGVEDTLPSPFTASKSFSAPSKPIHTKKKSSSPTSLSRPASHSPHIKKSTPTTLTTRASNILSNLRKMVENMIVNYRTNPLALMQFLTFVVAFLMLAGRRGVRERVRRMLGSGWTKVRQTAGMGVKVSYV